MAIVVERILDGKDRKRKQLMIEKKEGKSERADEARQSPIYERDTCGDWQVGMWRRAALSQDAGYNVPIRVGVVVLGDENPAPAPPPRPIFFPSSLLLF